MSTTETTSKMHLFLTRGLAAVVWSVAFVAASHSLTSSVTVGAAILVVLYPLIDVIASLIDARSQQGSARQLLLAGAAVSAVAAISLGVAATGSVADVITVFGVWAVVSGAAQLIVALRRRAQLGKQWPMRLAGGVSTIGGVAYIIAAAVGHPTLSMIAIYTFTGGVDFIVEAWLLARRRRRLSHPAAPLLSAN